MLRKAAFVVVLTVALMGDQTASAQGIWCWLKSSSPECRFKEKCTRYQTVEKCRCVWNALEDSLPTKDHSAMVDIFIGMQTQDLGQLEALGGRINATGSMNMWLTWMSSASRCR